MLLGWSSCRLSTPVSTGLGNETLGGAEEDTVRGTQVREEGRETNIIGGALAHIATTRAYGRRETYIHWPRMTKISVFTNKNT